MGERVEAGVVCPTRTATGRSSVAEPRRPCTAVAEAPAVFDEAAFWGHIGAGKIHSGRAPRRTKTKGGHER
jgi:hypothetical protein